MEKEQKNFFPRAEVASVAVFISLGCRQG